MEVIGLYATYLIIAFVVAFLGIVVRVALTGGSEALTSMMVLIVALIVGLSAGQFYQGLDKIYDMPSMIDTKILCTDSAETQDKVCDLSAETDGQITKAPDENCGFNVGCYFSKILIASVSNFLSIAKDAGNSAFANENFGIFNQLFQNSQLTNLTLNIALSVLGGLLVIYSLSSFPAIFSGKVSLLEFLSPIAGVLTKIIMTQVLIFLWIAFMQMVIDKIGTESVLNSIVGSSNATIVVTEGLSKQGIFYIFYAFLYVATLILSTYWNYILQILFVTSPIFTALSLVFPKAYNSLISKVFGYTLLPLLVYLIFIITATVIQQVDIIYGILLVLSAFVFMFSLPSFTFNLLGDFAPNLGNINDYVADAGRRASAWAKENIWLKYDLRQPKVPTWGGVETINPTSVTTVNTLGSNIKKPLNLSKPL
jgi:hypothetical protein